MPTSGHIASIFLLMALVLQEATSEGFFHRRNHEDQRRYSAVKVPNVVNTPQKAEEALQRYGYLRCNLQAKKRRPLKINVSNPAMNFGVPCSRDKIRHAIKRYQKRYKLVPTGRLDDDTLRLLSASRCGNRDDESPVGPLSKLNKVNDRRKRDISARNMIGTNPLKNILWPFPPHGDVSSRRRRWLENHMKRLENGELDEELAKIHNEVQEKRLRQKRGVEWIRDEVFSQDMITWRLVSTAYSDQFPMKSQRAALALAFRMWSEVIPRVFVEDIKSSVDQVDILIAFGKGEHMNCANNFDGLGGQLSHAIRLKSGAEIHVDDDEYYTMGSDQGTNLLKVAVHEVGHVLGLIHNPRNYSIMYAIYSESIPNNNFELGWEDRKTVQAIYGICEGSFDTVFDWVRRRPDGQRIYNTYFFRNNYYWMYENRYNRTRYGDPLRIAPEWKGVPDRVDGFAHVWTSYEDSALFFKGRHYWKYDSENDRVAPGYPRNISDSFRPIADSNYPAIPNNLDTVFFDKRDGNLYFFKDDLVYGYDVSKNQEGCCLPGYPKKISDEFPAHGKNEPLPANLDVVYYSYTDRTLYFFKGKQFWRNVVFNPLDRRRTNKVQGPENIKDKWYDICSVEDF